MPQTSTNKELNNRRLLFVGSVVLTVVLYKFLPFIAGPLTLLGTFVHETGHGLAGIMVGGDFRELHLTEWGGYAVVAMPRGGISSAVLSAGGLVGPSVVAMLSFIAARSPKLSRYFVGTVALVLVWLLVFKINGSQGYMVAGVLLLAAAPLALKGRDNLVQSVTVFFGIQLALSLYADTDYLFTQYFSANGQQMASDTQNMADALVGPYWFWALVCIALSLASLALGAAVLLLNRHKNTSPNA